MARGIGEVGCTAGAEIDDHTYTVVLAAALAVVLAVLAVRCRNVVGVFSDVVCVGASCVQPVHCQDHHGVVRH